MIFFLRYLIINTSINTSINTTLGSRSLGCLLPGLLKLNLECTSLTSDVCSLFLPRDHGRERTLEIVVYPHAGNITRPEEKYVSLFPPESCDNLNFELMKQYIWGGGGSGRGRLFVGNRGFWSGQHFAGSGRVQEKWQLCAGQGRISEGTLCHAHLVKKRFGKYRKTWFGFVKAFRETIETKYSSFMKS